jgi:anti-anti-sigma regulatory factor
MDRAAPSLDDLIAKAAFTSPGIGNNLSLKMVNRSGAIQLVLSGASAGGLPDHALSNVVAVLVAAKNPRVAVDLHACPILPSVAIAFLVQFQKSADEAGASKVVLFGVSPRVTTLLGMIGMKDFFVIVPTEADMVAWFDAHGA